MRAEVSNIFQDTEGKIRVVAKVEGEMPAVRELSPQEWRGAMPTPDVGHLSKQERKALELAQAKRAMSSRAEAVALVEPEGGYPRKEQIPPTHNEAWDSIPEHARPQDTIEALLRTRGRGQLERVLEEELGWDRRYLALSLGQYEALLPGWRRSSRNTIRAGA